MIDNAIGTQVLIIGGGPVGLMGSLLLSRLGVKQIKRYGNGEIRGKNRQPGEIGGVEVLPLPIQLLRIAATFS